MLLLAALWPVRSPVHAQQTPPPRQPLIQYVPPSVIRTNAPALRVKPLVPYAENDPTVPIIESKSLTVAQRRDKFEAEFGIQHPSSSFVKHSMQTMKYDLDDAVFTLKEFIQQNLNISYPLRNLGRSEPAPGPPRRLYANPVMDAWENARFETRISLSAGAQDPVGVRLVVPIGN